MLSHELNADLPALAEFEETMKSKLLVIFSMLMMALVLMAQNATQSTPAPSGDNTKSCACCNHDQAGGKMACSKDGGCCCQGKDGKECPMMSKDSSGKMNCCDKAGGCCQGKDGKQCPMMSKEGSGKMGGCCCGKMCQRPKSAA